MGDTDVLAARFETHRQTVLGGSIGPALLVILHTQAPASADIQGRTLSTGGKQWPV